MPFGSIDEKIANCDSEIPKILMINFFAFALVSAGRTDCAWMSIVVQCLIHGVNNILVKLICLTIRKLTHVSGPFLLSISVFIFSFFFSLFLFGSVWQIKLAIC